MVEGGGFEPPKAVPADLQSAPFGRSGTPPAKERRIVSESPTNVNHDSLHFPLYFYLVFLAYHHINFRLLYIVAIIALFINHSQKI